MLWMSNPFPYLSFIVKFWVKIDVCEQLVENNMKAKRYPTYIGLNPVLQTCR